MKMHLRADNCTERRLRITVFIAGQDCRQLIMDPTDGSIRIVRVMGAGSGDRRMNDDDPIARLRGETGK